MMLKVNWQALNRIFLSVLVGKTLMKILVVDDNDAQATTLAWLIEAWGYQTEVCTRGTDVLHCVAQFQPDVLLLDIAMPGASGLDICRQLRADGKAASLKIVAQTGYGDVDHKKQIDDAGFDGMLLKPIDLEVLERLLTGFRAEQTDESNT